jgi:hypothetical protein
VTLPVPIFLFSYILFYYFYFFFVIISFVYAFFTLLFEWRRLHNKELYALYSSPNIIRVIKSRRLRWAGHVARMGERRGAYMALVGKPE